MESVTCHGACDCGGGGGGDGRQADEGSCPNSVLSFWIHWIHRVGLKRSKSIFGYVETNPRLDETIWSESVNPMNPQVEIRLPNRERVTTFEGYLGVLRNFHLSPSPTSRIVIKTIVLKTMESNVMHLYSSCPTS